MQQSIGSRLREWRRLQGLTQEGFHQLTGLHIGMIRKYESGDNSPGSGALLTFAKTGVNLNWLVLGVGSPKTCVCEENAPNSLEQTLLELKTILAEVPETQAKSLIAEFHNRAKELKRASELERIIRQIAKNMDK